MAVRNPGGGVLAAGSVKTASIENEAVSPAKTLPGTTPTPGAVEKEIVLGVAGVARKFVGAITGDGVKTAWKIKHGLETQAVQVNILTASAKLPSEEPVTLLGKAVAISASEVEVTFTVAPGAKVENFIIIVG